MNPVTNVRAATAAVILLSVMLSACGGGGGSSPQGQGGNSPPVPVPVTAPAAPALKIKFSLKHLHMFWDPVPGATSYRIMRDSDGLSGFTQWGDDVAVAVTSPEATRDLSVHLIDWINAHYRVDACNTAGCTASAALTAPFFGQHDATGYFKALNTEPGDLFGFAVAVSGDGRTMAVAAPEEDSGSSLPQDNTMSDAGAVYIFTITPAGPWGTQAYLKAHNRDAGDRFGSALALSYDGNTLVIGARYEDSAATGIDGNALDDTAHSAGAAYVFTRETDGWSQAAYLKASNAEADDEFGAAVSMSGDGNLIAVGAPYEDSSVDGIDGNQNTNLADGAGAVYLFARQGSAWSQSAYVKSGFSGAGHTFGTSMAVSRDGRAFIVGAPGEGSGATGVGGSPSSNTRPDSGAAYLFTLGKQGWEQEAYLKASRAISSLGFGFAVAIDANGSTVAVSALGESSSATGVDGDQDDTAASHAGAVYVFGRELGGLSQQAYVKASNTGANDAFGYAIALNDAGTVLAVGAPQEASAGAGVGGNQADDSLSAAGAAYVFTRGKGQWSQRNYLKATPSDLSDHFGRSIAMNADGGILDVGTNDDSAATGAGNMGNRPNDNSAVEAGSVYVY